MTAQKPSFNRYLPSQVFLSHIVYEVLPELVGYSSTLLSCKVANKISDSSINVVVTTSVGKVAELVTVAVAISCIKEAMSIAHSIIPQS